MVATFIFVCHKNPIMKPILVFSFAVLLFAACSNNNNADTAKLFCDTTCNNDSFLFKSDAPLHPFVSISVNNCIPDTLTWGHDKLDNDRKMHISTLLDKTVRINKSAINCYIKDTSNAWLSFNDCITGRGYLLKLPFNKANDISKYSGAINSFDKKFVLPDDMRAYADYSTIYVVDVNTGKTEQMTFKEELNFSFDNIHKAIDSVNVSHNRIYVLLNKDGQKVPLEKNISL